MVKKLALLSALVLASISIHAADKPVITVLDFSTGSLSKNEMRSIISFLSSAIFKTGQYTVIDVHQRENLLRELSFSSSDCSDLSCSLRIGRQLAAEFIIVGSVEKVGSRFVVSTKMLEVETGTTKSSAEGIYVSVDAIVDDLYTIASRLAGIESEDPAGTAAPTPVPTEAPKKTAEPLVTLAPAATTAPAGGPASDAVRDIKTSAAAASATSFSIGALAGWTIPLGDVNRALGMTFTPLAFFHLNQTVEEFSFGYGIAAGFQTEDSLTDFPVAYSMIMLPVLADFTFAYHIVPGVWSVGAGASAGLCVNAVNFSDPAEDDLLTAKPMAVPTVHTGIEIGNIRIFVYDSIFAVFFDDSIYAANSLGAGIEIKF